MFVEMDALNVLVPFAIIGFIVTMGVVWFYFYKWSKAATYKVLTKFFSK